MEARVLITGAAGFLGRAFVKHHLAQGDDVWVVDDLSNPHSRFPDNIDVRHVFAGDAGDWFRANKEATFDIAYHFAAPVGGRVKIEGDPLFNADSLRLDSEFFRWACGRVGIAVYPSSSAVYGVTYQQNAVNQLTEALFDPRDAMWAAPDEMYGFTKMAGEILAYKAMRYGLNTLCIRPFSGYGEDQGLDYPIPAICYRAKRREDPLIVWGSGSQQRDFIHVDDLVQATLARMAVGVHGYQTMNIGSGRGTTFRTIAALAAEVVGYRPSIQIDRSKPEGVQIRVCDPMQMQHYYKPTIDLALGLKRVLNSLP